MALRSKFFI